MLASQTRWVIFLVLAAAAAVSATVILSTRSAPEATTRPAPPSNEEAAPELQRQSQPALSHRQPSESSTLPRTSIDDSAQDVTTRGDKSKSLSKEDRQLFFYIAQKVGKTTEDLVRIVATPEQLRQLRDAQADMKKHVGSVWGNMHLIQNRIHMKRVREGPYELIPAKEVTTVADQPQPQFPGQLVSTGVFWHEELGKKMVRVVRINPGEFSDLDEAAAQFAEAQKTEVEVYKDLIRSFRK